MGVSGAAVATVLAQIIALMFQFWRFSDKSKLLHFRRGIYRLKKDLVAGIFSIGLSPFLMNAASCLVVIVINQGLQKHGGDLAIGAYGIINRLAFLFIMIVIGINQGMQPIVGYNYGANRYDRVIEVLKKTVVFATAVTTCGFLVGILIPRLAVSIFTSDQDLISIAAEGLRLSLLFFPLLGFQMVSGIFFQSIGKVKKAIFMSLTRQLIFLVPLLLVLPNILGTVGVWWSLAMADLISSVVAFILLTGMVRKLKMEHNTLSNG